jgi:2-methylisocitrate lyase-like PEP mutase family enzyme
VDRTAALRRLLQRPGVLLGPAAYDGISARLTEEAGFDFAFMSGFSVAGARLAKPDTGLLSYGEMLDQGRSMHEATTSIPIIGDGDTGASCFPTTRVPAPAPAARRPLLTARCSPAAPPPPAGYGNALNVQRTVRGYASAGFAGILIEDQVWPKSCGHVRGKRVVPRAEAVARVRAACDARDAGRDIVVVARTDARQGESFQEALYRAAAFADAGADVVFVDALESAAEMRTLCAQVGGAAKMANMLEGGGKTPILTPAELGDMGFKLCAYPLSLLGVAVAAQRRALAGLKQGRVPVPPEMLTFEELQAAVGFPEYFAQEARYAVADAPAGGGRPEAAVEADLVVEPDGSSGQSSSSSSSSGGGGGGRSGAADPSATIDLYAGDAARGGGGDYATRRAQWLRIKISPSRGGPVKLDTRFPAGFLNSVAAFVPQVAGVDLEGLVREAKGGAWAPGAPVLEFEADSDTVQVFLEFE